MIKPIPRPTSKGIKTPSSKIAKKIPKIAPPKIIQNNNRNNVNFNGETGRFPAILPDSAFTAK